MGGKWLKKARVEEKHDSDKAFEDFRPVLDSPANVFVTMVLITVRGDRVLSSFGGWPEVRDIPVCACTEETWSWRKLQQHSLSWLRTGTQGLCHDADRSRKPFVCSTVHVQRL